MSLDPRSLILFAANAVLILLVQLLNNTLTGWSLYLFILGPVVVLPPLYLRHSAALTCAILTGLWADAASPAPFGCFTITLACLSTLLSFLRLRFRPEGNAHPLPLAHGANLILFLTVSLAAWPDLLRDQAYWLRLGTDLVFSHVALLVIAPWFFDFQRCLFRLLRMETEPDNLPLP